MLKYGAIVLNSFSYKLVYYLMKVTLILKLNINILPTLLQLEQKICTVLDLVKLQCMLYGVAEI